MPGPSSKLRRGRRLKDRSPGAWGEDLALRYLIKRGYKLLERNYRTRRGEIDLIVRKDETLVIYQSAWKVISQKFTSGSGARR